MWPPSLPPDPKFNLCSLPDCQISWNCFTYLSVQIWKICPGGLKALKSDPPQKIMRCCIYYSRWLSCLLNSTWPIWSRVNVLYEPCTSSQKAHRRGRPLNIFAWFIGAGGSFFLSRARVCALSLRPHLSHPRFLSLSPVSLALTAHLSRSLYLLFVLSLSLCPLPLPTSPPSLSLSSLPSPPNPSLSLSHPRCSSAVFDEKYPPRDLSAFVRIVNARTVRLQHTA